MARGQLIVIEGLDGSGKATQAELLYDYFQKADKPAVKISFPDYESESSVLVRMYLSGEIGALNEVNAYAASSFYAADRYISYTRLWKERFESGYTIIADRYTTSNVTHQMTKLVQNEWDGYLEWLDNFEYECMGLPRPDVVIYLDMLPETSRALLEKRYEGYNAKNDIHEQNLAYLQECRQAALYAAGKLGWKVIRCCDGKNPLRINTIAEAVINTLKLNDIN